MSILFWPETQVVEIFDFVDRENSCIGTASQVMLASGNVAGRLAAAGFIQGPVHTNGFAKTSIFVLQVK